MKIVDLFPIPFVIEELTIDKSESDFVINYLSDEKNLSKNKNNYSGTDTYILEYMPKLKGQIDISIENYVSKFLGETADVKITQSWLNYNPPGTFHHKHKHANSIVSGVVYLQADEKTGSLNMYRPENQKRQIHNEIETWNPYNYEYMFFTPKFGDMFLFPGTVYHDTEVNRSTISKISLGFNTFYSGSFGSIKELTRVR
jgi:uncharacterized protein (TIGR02466 family)